MVHCASRHWPGSYVLDVEQLQALDLCLVLHMLLFLCGEAAFAGMLYSCRMLMPP